MATTMKETIRPMIEEAEKIVEVLNMHFFDGSLPTPVITIAPHPKGKALGWCSSKKVWDDTERFVSDESLIQMSPEELEEMMDSGYYEINLCPEYLSRDIMEVYETLLHELVHLYNAQRGIKDTSNHGYYHNEQFKAACAMHGLNCEKMARYGWAKTSLSEEAFVLLADYAESSGSPIFRKRLPEQKQGGRKSVSRTFTCPGCGIKVRVTKGGTITLTHNECGCEFVET